MSMIVFNKKLITEHNQVKQAWNQLLMQRESFNINQNTISAQYGGALRIETRPGHGFCLHIELPVSETAPAFAPLPASPPEPTPELSSGGTP